MDDGAKRALTVPERDDVVFSIELALTCDFLTRMDRLRSSDRRALAGHVLERFRRDHHDPMRKPPIVLRAVRTAS